MADIKDYKCPNCGAALTWDAASKTLKCGGCGTEFDPEVVEAYTAAQEQSAPKEYYWNSESNGEVFGDEVRYYTCPNCGAEILADENTSATQCMYCDSPIVVAERIEDTLKPDLIVPFAITKEQAKAALKEHCKGKKLLPKSFTSENKLDEMKGVYVPVWLFDCDAEGFATFNCKNIRTWSDGDYRYTRTDHYLVQRGGKAAFSHIPVDGSSKANDELMESIEPFHTKNAEPFSTAYLPGYLADKYDVDERACEPRANERVRSSVESLLSSTCTGYTSVIPTNCSVDTSNGKVHYALLPVWFLNTKYRGKVYTFAMNGQTGAFAGDLPVDRGRFWGYFFGYTAIIGTIASIVSMFIM